MVLPKIVSLFSGAGGLDHGFMSAGFPVVLAMDIATAAVETHAHNFPQTMSVAADLIKLGPKGVSDHALRVVEQGDAIGVIGGPPCQGFSRANTKSTALDPRNRLPLLYLKAVHRLQAEFDVKFVMFENVVGIRDSKHSRTFDGILAKFGQLGFCADAVEYAALDFGVPQKRNRVIISGFRDVMCAEDFRPIPVLRDDLSVRAAIGHLPEPVYFSRDLKVADIPYHPNHWTMRPLSRRFSEPETYSRPSRCFRRLKWDEPSPTVAYGHREIHVHPNGHRRLSIYEAMLLQGFPSDFVLKGTLSAQVEQVSNAVPPPMARALADAVAVTLHSSGRVANSESVLSA